MKKALQPNHVLCNSCCSVTKSCPTLCDPMDCSTPDSLCPPLSPGVYSDSCSSCQWCYLSISSSAALFFSCPQSFPESGSFWMNRHFASGGKSFGASASASVLPMNIQGWFPLGLTDLISLLELSSVFSSTTVWKHQVSGAQAALITCLPVTLQVDALGWLQKMSWTRNLKKSYYQYMKYVHTLDIWICSHVLYWILPLHRDETLNRRTKYISTYAYILNIL